MKQTTKSILLSVRKKLTEVLDTINTYMHDGDVELPEEDLAACQEVFNSLSETLDLL